MKAIFTFLLKAIFWIAIVTFFDIPAKISRIDWCEIKSKSERVIKNGVAQVYDLCDKPISNLAANIEEYIGQDDLDLVENEIVAEKMEVHKVEVPEDTIKKEQWPSIERYPSKEDKRWILAADDIKVDLYYNASEQGNANPRCTASGFIINPNDLYSHKIIAMERALMQSLGLDFGDVVKIQDTGRWDGVWQIQDIVHPKYDGQKKISILMANHVTYSTWENIKLYILTDKENTSVYKYHMAPSEDI